MAKVDLTNPLYKYTPAKYAEKMVSEGWLRIGTLSGYRDMEKLGDVIGDEAEGIRQLMVKGLGFTGSMYITSYQSDDVTLRNVNINISGFAADKVPLRIITRSTDYYTFCTTSEYNSAVMAEFKCDTCVVITNPNQFFEEVTMMLRRLGYTQDSEPLLGTCVYSNKNTVLMGAKINRDDRGQPDIRFHKAPKYSNQKEVRALWTPMESEIFPINIQVPGIVGTCELYGGE
ncbi:hypothetical protein [Spirosoma koreense]